MFEVWTGTNLAVKNLEFLLCNKFLKLHDSNSAANNFYSISSIPSFNTKTSMSRSSMELDLVIS